MIVIEHQLTSLCLKKASIGRQPRPPPRCVPPAASIDEGFVAACELGSVVSLSRMFASERLWLRRQHDLAEATPPPRGSGSRFQSERFSKQRITVARSRNNANGMSQRAGSEGNVRAALIGSNPASQKTLVFVGESRTCALRDDDTQAFRVCDRMGSPPVAIPAVRKDRSRAHLVLAAEGFDLLRLSPRRIATPLQSISSLSAPWEGVGPSVAQKPPATRQRGEADAGGMGVVAGCVGGLSRY